MKRYEITLKGLSPLLMHKDNIQFGEKLKLWRTAPENKIHIVKGDDRSPAWSWIGYLYHDGKTVGIDADNIMTMLREGGAKIPTGTKQETYKKYTQSGLILDQPQFSLLMPDGAQVKMDDIRPLVGNMEFADHLEAAEVLGFELLVKRAKIGAAKHVRVRPMFREWTAVGSVTVFDEKVSGLTMDILKTILNQAGALCGLGDWRPSSPKASGMFGRFTPEVRKI